MSDFVSSTRWVRGIVLMISTAFVWAMSIPDASPWNAVVVMSCGLSVVWWLRAAAPGLAPRAMRVAEAQGRPAVVTGTRRP